MKQKLLFTVGSTRNSIINKLDGFYLLNLIFQLIEIYKIIFGLIKVRQVGYKLFILPKLSFGRAELHQ